MHPNALVCWRYLGQGDRVMPDAIEGLLVLTWLEASLSSAEKHSGLIVCQVISGNVILFCLFADLSVLPPNRRLQLTPLRVERDRANFENRFRLHSHLVQSMRRN